MGLAFRNGHPKSWSTAETLLIKYRMNSPHVRALFPIYPVQVDVNSVKDTVASYLLRVLRDYYLTESFQIYETLDSQRRIKII